MGKYYIRGGKPLSGKVRISGAKNAVLPVLAASVMTGGENVFYGCPEISDAESMLKILGSLGCKVHRCGEKVSVDASGMTDCRIPEELMKEMRSSVFLAGSLLARCGEAVISNPGGCDIGARPIDIHIDGLTKLGARVEQTEDRIIIKAERLKGTDIYLPYPSVGATENLMMAAMAAEGITRLHNSAREPEICALQEYINKCGGRVRGAGSSLIEIEGGRRLRGCELCMIPDRIEAGTYLLAALGTGGEIELEGIGREPLGPLIDILEEGGFDVEWGRTFICAKASGDEHICRRIDTAPYPGFPTDLQPQMTAFLTRYGAGSTVTENIFEKRLEYAKQLKKMGAHIEICEKQVIIKDNNILCGTSVSAEDLRGGAALMIAGFMADGETVIGGTKYIKRGYGRLIEKIRVLGGEIREDES